jgi:predicted small lipoprotein YifL
MKMNTKKCASVGPRARRALGLALMTLVPLLMAGCGQKGPLKLPAPAQPASAASPAPR